MSERLNDPLASVLLARQNRLPSIAEAPDSRGDPFWDIAEIDETRWDASYPFQLILVKRKATGKGYDEVPLGRFTLPIPPTSMQITTPFAITTSVLQEGIVEEHNGAPLKMISFQGTTGVLPGRGTGKLLTSTTIGQSILAGTVRAAQQTSQAISAFVPEAQNPHLSPVIRDADILGELKGTTGYYQFLMLQGFLERYAHMKKTEAGKKYRLAFAIWKTKEVYLVTPENLSVNRSAGSLKYNYSLTLKAWRRITLNQGASSHVESLNVARDPGLLQQVLQKIEEGRRVLHGIKETIEAVRQDIDATLYEPLRNTALFLKDSLGVAITAADLPLNIVRDMKSAILEAAGVAQDLGDDVRQLRNRVRAYARLVNKTETQAAELQQSGAGLGSEDPDPANADLENPGRNFEFFSKLKIGELNLQPMTFRKIIQERERVRGLRRSDFERMRDQFVTVLADFEASVGAGSEVYAQTYGRPVPTVTREATPEDFDAIFAMNDIIMEMNKLAASGNLDQSRLTPIEYIAGLAGRSGINFQVPRSYLRVPFPYGSTLEQVALQYLGDPNRWHEIAALNRLREPFVDEEGFDLPLLVNGRGNEVVVNTAKDLYVGQSVWLSSTTTVRTKRRISDIRHVIDGYVVLRLDGDPDLERFSTMAKASLHAFLPETVNSQMLIAIPSDRPAEEGLLNGKPLADYEWLLQIGGVDLLLTSDGDAAITPDGDWRLAYGLTNLVQRVNLFMNTPRGALLHHQTYGFKAHAGMSTADITAQELLTSVQDLFTFDPVFTGIRSAQVLKQGPVMRMAVSLEVAGGEQLIPVSFDVRR